MEPVRPAVDHGDVHAAAVVAEIPDRLRMRAAVGDRDGVVQVVVDPLVLVCGDDAAQASARPSSIAEPRTATNGSFSEEDGLAAERVDLARQRSEVVAPRSYWRIVPPPNASPERAQDGESEMQQAS